MSDVRRYVQECIECQKGNNPRHGRVPLGSMPIITNPFDVVAADIVGPLPMTLRKHWFILTLMDMASRYPEAVPLKKATSKVVLEVMLQFFYRFGYPSTLPTDNGSIFTSKLLMTAVCSKLEIKRITTIYNLMEH